MDESNEPGTVVVATQLKHATNVWSRFRGLMLRGGLAPGEALAIEPCASIHMFFMRFSIDAIFYDRQHRVTKFAGESGPGSGLPLEARAPGEWWKRPPGRQPTSHQETSSTSAKTEHSRRLAHTKAEGQSIGTSAPSTRNGP